MSKLKCAHTLNITTMYCYLNFVYHHCFIIRIKQVQVSGTKYTTEDIVVLGKTDDLPVLGRITKIFIDEDQCLFVSKLILLEFHPHYNAYEIVGTGSTIVTTPDRLLSFHPHNTHTCFSPSLATSQFVCLKQHFL